MSEGEEHKIWHGELFPMSALKPQRSAATSASCSFPFATRVEHRARDEDWLLLRRSAGPLRELFSPCQNDLVSYRQRLSKKHP
jgi:hypothetical protein